MPLMPRPAPVIIDSTGLKVCGQGEWHTHFSSFKRMSGDGLRAKWDASQERDDNRLWITQSDAGIGLAAVISCPLRAMFKEASAGLGCLAQQSPRLALPIRFAQWGDSQ